MISVDQRPAAMTQQVVEVEVMRQGQFVCFLHFVFVFLFVCLFFLLSCVGLFMNTKDHL